MASGDRPGALGSLLETTDPYRLRNTSHSIIGPKSPEDTNLTIGAAQWDTPVPPSMPEGNFLSLATDSTIGQLPASATDLAASVQSSFASPGKFLDNIFSSDTNVARAIAMLGPFGGLSEIGLNFAKNALELQQSKARFKESLGVPGYGSGAFNIDGQRTNFTMDPLGLSYGYGWQPSTERELDAIDQATNRAVARQQDWGTKYAPGAVPSTMGDRQQVDIYDEWDAAMAGAMDEAAASFDAYDDTTDEAEGDW